MEQQRQIDGAEYCLTETYSNQAVYSPCPAPPNAAAVFSLTTIAALAVVAVAWVIPAIARRRSQYQSIILNATRSL